MASIHPSDRISGTPAIVRPRVDTRGSVNDGLMFAIPLSVALWALILLAIHLFIG